MGSRTAYGARDVEMMSDIVTVPGRKLKAMQDRIAELEAEIERLDKAFDWAAQKNAQLKAENERLRKDKEGLLEALNLSNDKCIAWMQKALGGE